MSGSLNRATLIGHLGADQEIRHNNDVSKVVHLRIATSESWRDRTSGERREKTEWHRVTCFNEALGKVAQQYLRKGAKVLVEGKIQTRKWTDQSGADRYSTEIVLGPFDAKLLMLGDKNEAGEPREPSPPADAALDDEVPW